MELGTTHLVLGPCDHGDWAAPKKHKGTSLSIPITPTPGKALAGSSCTESFPATLPELKPGCFIAQEHGGFSQLGPTRSIQANTEKSLFSLGKEGEQLLKFLTLQYSAGLG